MAESPKRASDSLAIQAPVLGPATKKAKPSDNDDAPDVPAVAARGEVADLASEDDPGDDSDDSSDSYDEGPYSSTSILVKQLYGELFEGADSLVQCMGRRNHHHITRRNARVALWEVDKLSKSLMQFKREFEAEVRNFDQ
jgi:hypothetical protein